MVQRRALVVGIDHYDNFPGLRCAVNDAHAVASLLERNDDGSLNYEIRLLVSGPDEERVTRGFLRQKWIELFENFDGDVLFFFSGHGAQTPWGAVLATQDGTPEELGVSMEDLLLLSNRSTAGDITLILDCCYSGQLGNPPILQALNRPLSLLREGVTVLAASRPNEEAYEANGHGLFTDALTDGLSGGAADHMGNVSAASLYLYAERLFGAWDQCPVYKSHTGTVSSLRMCRPAVETDTLRSLSDYFPDPKARLRLDPEYESEADPGEADPTRAKKRDDARRFKELRNSRMLESVSGEDFYWTAMDSKEIQLTQLGKYYWRLLKAGKI